MSGYSFHPEAFEDIDEIRAYIAADSPEAADRFVIEFFERIRSLPAFPGQGFRRPNLTGRPVRFVLVREYLIAYAPETSPLRVLAVIHGRRQGVDASNRLPADARFAASMIALICN
jgi:plasmid stabilization system protein ParE